MSLIQETLYFKYISDRLGYDVLENESGFIIYKISGKECFIVDMCVESHTRSSGHGMKLFKELKSIALEGGCDFLSGTIHLFDKNACDTLAKCLHAGFKIQAAQNNILTIILNINGGGL